MLASLALMMALAQPQLPAVPVLPPPKPKLICRADEQQVGSHIHTGRRCKTEEEWRIEDGRLDPRSSPSMRVTDGQSDPFVKQRPPL